MSSKVVVDDAINNVRPVVWQSAGSAQKLANVESIDRSSLKSEGNLAELQLATQDAYLRGFNDGKRIGHDQAHGEVVPVIERLTRRLSDLAQLRARMRQDAEQDLVKLSIGIARRILHRELTLDPESIHALVKVVLEKLQVRDILRVRVNVEQSDLVRASLERLGVSGNLEVVTDAALPKGDFEIETSHGTLDASIESQLREVERGFADRLR